MSAHRYQSSRPNPWFEPRAHRDASQRYHSYGPIQPMDQPGGGLFSRLFRFA